jgi:hypothetical protein
MAFRRNNNEAGTSRGCRIAPKYKSVNNLELKISALTVCLEVILYFLSVAAEVSQENVNISPYSQRRNKEQGVKSQQNDFSDEKGLVLLLFQRENRLILVAFH